MKRFIPCLITYLIFGGALAMSEEEIHDVTWETTCQTQKIAEISHIFNDDGRSSLNRYVSNKYAERSVKLKILENTYRYPKDGPLKTVYFLKLTSSSNEHLYSTTIQPENFHVSNEKIEVFSDLVNLSLKLREQNNARYGTLVFTNEISGFDNSTVFTEVSLVPLICL